MSSKILPNKALNTLRSIFKENKINTKPILSIFILCLIILSFMLILIEVFSKHYTFAFFKTNSLTNVTWVLLQKDVDKFDLKGKIIAFDFPLDTKYFKKDTPFAKEVKCQGGDNLSTQDRDYFCNNHHIGKARIADSKGAAVKQFVFNGVIPKDSYFVMGDNPNSFDSRYWGFLTKDKIKGVAIWEY